MSRFLMFALFVGLGSAKVDECVKKTSCSCENSKGILDLSPLAHSDNTPAFKDLPAIGEVYEYSWNPCNPFNEGQAGSTTDNSCQHVAACQVASEYLVYNLGDQKSATFETSNDGAITLQYSHKLASEPGGITARAAHVKLVCKKGSGPGKTVALGEVTGDSGIYNFVYTGKYACMKESSSGGHTLSIGSILCIVFFLVLIFYIVAGILFQVFYRKSSGVEMMPNRGMWTAIGSSIKDGCSFTFCRCKGREPTYGEV